ncbi:uncharacterized protein [Magallana gigas]|uniref:uncharacterized protein n=1 Tax=Magallana gigas TaxID=29159 RepID=UPI003340F1C6
MVPMPLPRKLVLPAVNRVPVNGQHSNPFIIEGNLHSKTQRLNPNPEANNLKLVSQFAMKVADRRIGITPQNPMPAGLKQNVIEIFSRKNKHIRGNMYIDHKENVSYHHVNLLLEDGQRRPPAPIKVNNIKQVDDLRTQTKKDEVKYTLIMSLRSGSTITSRLLKTNDTFFFFEPFQGLFRGRMRRTNQHVCYPDGYCRKPYGVWESSNGTVLLINNLLSCNFMDVPVGAIEAFRKFPASSYQQEFKSCFPVNKTDWNKRLYTLSEYPEQYNKTCIERLQQLCLQSPHRLIKTIRMPGSFAELFLSYIPNLRIIHLVRDPRGILNSRAQAHFINYEDKGISFVFNHLCSRIWLDVQAIKRLQQDNPTRVYHVTYECLALYPEDTARMLYKDLSLDFTPELHDWLQMAFRNKAEQEFNHYKYGQSSSISQNWRSYIPVNANEKINQRCVKVLLELGLKKFSSTADLRDLRNSVFYNSQRTCFKHV